MPDDPTIISDDPNAPPPDQNVQAVVDAGGGSPYSQVSGSAQIGTDERPDQSGMDQLITAATPPQVSTVNNAGLMADNQDGTGEPAVGSTADNVVQALKAGYNWDQISQYLGKTQPVGDTDELVNRKAKRPPLDHIWYGGPN